MKPLQSFVNRGLNLVTGVSPSILVSDVELDTGTRIVGNGSKIRRDSKPWSFFNLENEKEGNSVVSYIFRGYKTRRELIGELRHQNESSQKRIYLEKSKVEEREANISSLTTGGRLDDIMYCIDDTRKHL